MTPTPKLNRQNILFPFHQLDLGNTSSAPIRPIRKTLMRASLPNDNPVRHTPQPLPIIPKPPTIPITYYICLLRSGPQPVDPYRARIVVPNPRQFGFPQLDFSRH